MPGDFPFSLLLDALFFACHSCRLPLQGLRGHVSHGPPSVVKQGKGGLPGQHVDLGPHAGAQGKKAGKCLPSAIAFPLCHRGKSAEKLFFAYVRAKPWLEMAGPEKKWWRKKCKERTLSYRAQRISLTEELIWGNGKPSLEEETSSTMGPASW